MSPAPETVLRRVRDVVGTGGVERLAPGAVRLLLRELLFDGEGVPEWHEHAACRDTDPELFVPEQPSREQVEAAKQICARCPVRAECLADVMPWERPGHRHGVAGGLSGNEREQLHRTTRKAPKGGAAA